MKRWWRAIAVFVRRANWTQPPEWTEADARALGSFLGSATGAKLQKILRSEIASANERAAMSKGAPFECGWACGYRGLHAWFESLSARPAEGTEAMETDPLEQLAP